jgi:hypothetical protein
MGLALAKPFIPPLPKGSQEIFSLISKEILSLLNILFGSQRMENLKSSGNPGGIKNQPEGGLEVRG